MEKEYKIKGIEKILEKVSKEKLAKYYGVDINSDFEEVITQTFKEQGIPNNSEIGIYVKITKEEFDKSVEEGKKLPNSQEIASEFYNNDERKRAMYGINYGIDIEDFESEIYFVVDEPIKASALENMLIHPNHCLGGYDYNGLLMGSKFYEEHKDEFEKFKPNKNNIEAVDKYIENFMNEFKDLEFTGGYGPRPKYEETEEIRTQKAKSEDIILKLTGKESIEEMSLRDFINLKRSLEKEEKDLQREFEEKFAGKDYE